MKKKKIALMVMVTVLAGLSSFGFFRQTQAQIIDSHTFFIPFPADMLGDHFEKGGNDPLLTFSDEDIVTTISIAIVDRFSIIHYDHWEDGLEPILDLPTQPSTEIWGDDNAANGIPPGFGIDILNDGDVIVLEEIIVLPRDPNDFFYDGGDTLTAYGSSLAR